MLHFETVRDGRGFSWPLPILLSLGNALRLTRDSLYTVSLGNQAKYIVPADLAHAEFVIVIVRFLTAVLGLALWGLSAWFFLVSVGSLFKYMRPVHRAKMPFQMTWFSFVFPITALARIRLPSPFRILWVSKSR